MAGVIPPSRYKFDANVPKLHLCLLSNFVAWTFVRLEWTQKKAGELFGLGERRAREICTNLRKQKSAVCHRIGQTIAFI